MPMFLKFQSAPISILQRIKNRLRHYSERIIGRVSLIRLNSKKDPIWPTANVDKRDMVIVAPTAEIKDYVIIRAFHELITIGDYSQINPFTVIYGGAPIVIGNNVMIGPHCTISSGNHDYQQIERPMRHAGNLIEGPIIIEDDVWVGANCVVTDGVRIGRGAVIGAGTVITKDVAPFAVIVGASQRILKMRM
ncbi:uncharacterized protein NMK_0842 [Novimethylophilus kurashikiensis]|uniref:Acyltransferase n=1 Tax=Novimethylophilus kurashikiensis TaxID=1825523 RepID=A0A2R5F4F0_9PROT|nr:acyltransferase [Novimethylophilus kurashikiensis]GBG13296.1 uncharacterized protein NMK_0842 [Novimethylophilus kurashikiensis]